MIKQTIISGSVPVHIWTDDIDEATKNQILEVSLLPVVFSHVALMPDAHLGKGATIGSVIPTKSAVIPSAVGVDLGCGMLAVKTNLTANDLPDDLKSIRHNIEREIPVGFNCHKDESHVPRGYFSYLTNRKVQHLLDLYNIKERRQTPIQQLATLGGGNHFIELCLDENNDVWIMLHSGSRGIGNAIGSKFIELAKQDMAEVLGELPNADLAYLKKGSTLFDDYCFLVEFAQGYASANRFLMLTRVLRCLKHDFPHLDVEVTDKVVSCHHNYISHEHHFGEDLIVTRKGAVSAKKGELGIIPGSMGAKSYIVEGLGNPESFCSCSHGAGRRMSRNQAKKTFSLHDHELATQGVECRKDANVIDETPMAYKDIDEVMRNQSDLVRPIHTLKQFLCIKG